MADAALHQASCVAIGNRAVLIQGPSGSGKSSLALALIDRGAHLIADDATTLTVAGGELIASPPPRLAGCLEIRNVGIVSVPLALPCPIAIVLSLDPASPRFIDQASVVEMLGISVPVLSLWPDSPYLALRAEWALRVHGLGSPGPRAHKDRP